MTRRAHTSMIAPLLAASLAPSLAAAILCACTASTPSATPKDALAARFAIAAAQQAHDLSPDLYARAERARQDALHTDDAAARCDHEERAELLLEAAIAESERIASERAAAAADARAEQSQEQRAELERKRLALDQATSLEVAARYAHAQAARGAPQSNAESEQTATFLRDRASLSLAGAIALGLDAIRADALERAIAQAKRAASGAARVSAAKHVLAQVQQALDETRRATHD